MATAILRIKDENGNWREIPAVKGEKGEQGVSIDTIVFKNKVGTVSTYEIQLTDGKKYTFTVTNGNLIKNIALLSTDVLIDTYRIYLDDSTYYDFTVTNGRGINNIAKTGTDVLSDTYTISYNDNTTSTFKVTNGRSIVQINKTKTDVLTDTYTISYNDNTTSTYTIKNGRGIDYIEKDEVIGLSDRYTIHYNDGTTSYYHVVNGAAGPAGSIGNRIYLSGLVDKVNDEEGYNRVKELYDSSDKTVKIDTIKSNNYTVVGSPTITNDGIFTAGGVGNTASKGGLSITATNEIRYYSRCIYKAVEGHNDHLFPQINYTISGITHNINTNVFNDNGTFKIGVVDEKNENGTFTIINQANTIVEIPLKDGDIFDTEVICNNTNIIFNATLNEKVNYTVSIPSPGLGILTGWRTITTNYWAGAIDLNTIHVYVDGNLVYQPCLKIPYTTSKTGSKIVDAANKLRVESCYNQYGAGNYYLLSTADEKFGLPMPDIYGLINVLENKKVNRAGDTMTGPLILHAPNHPQLVVQRNNNNFGAVQDDQRKYASVWFKGNDAGWTAYLQEWATHQLIGENDFGMNQLHMGVRCQKSDGTYTQTGMGICAREDGPTWAFAPNPANKLDNSTQIATTHWVREHRCTTAAGTTSTASVDAPCYVVQNYVNGTSWYRIWSDGWIEQGGVTNVGGGGNHNINLMKPLKNGMHVFCIGRTAVPIPNGYWGNGGVINGSSFNVYNSAGDNTHINWFAYGYKQS